MFYSIMVVNITEFIKNRRVRVLPLKNFCLCEFNPLRTQQMNFLLVLGSFALSFKFFFEFISVLF